MAPFDSLAAELWPKKTILPRCVVTRCLSVRLSVLSVRPSVTRRYFVETVIHHGA